MEFLFPFSSFKMRGGQIYLFLVSPMLSLSPVLVVGVVGKWFLEPCAAASCQKLLSAPIRWTDVLRIVKRIQSVPDSAPWSQADTCPKQTSIRWTEVKRRWNGGSLENSVDESGTAVERILAPELIRPRIVKRMLERIHRVLAFPGIRWRWSTDIKRMFDGLLGFRIFCSTKKHQVRDILRQKLLSLTNFQKYTK